MQLALPKAPAFSLASPLLKLSLLFLVIPGFARAQCENKTTTADIVECLNGELKKADADLNRVYQATLKKLAQQDGVKLRKAQRAWIAYRDAHCDAEYSLYQGGSIAPVVFGNCKLTLTQQRTKEIQTAYADH